MGIIPAVLRRDIVHRLEVRLQNDFINSFLLRAETAIDREGAGDIAGIAVDFATSINQY